MENQNTAENGKQELNLTCPFFQVPCVSHCPAWLTAIDDCLFHVCLTDVQEVFFEAARYLDARIGLVPGAGGVIMQGARDGLNGGGGVEVAKHCMNALITSGIMAKLTGYLPTRLGDLLSGVERRMVFDFKSLFDAFDEEESEQE